MYISFAIGVWMSMYFAYLFFGQCRIMSNCLSVCFLSMEEKYKIIDGEFYLFMTYCKRNIPEHASVALANVRESQEKRFSKQWIQSEYYIQKLPYYLFPRKIYRIHDAPAGEPLYIILYDREAGGSHFELRYQEAFIP
jgi:hypothetical protein